MVRGMFNASLEKLADPSYDVLAAKHRGLYGPVDNWTFYLAQTEDKIIKEKSQKTIASDSEENMMSPLDSEPISNVAVGSRWSLWRPLKPSGDLGVAREPMIISL